MNSKNGYAARRRAEARRYGLCTTCCVRPVEAGLCRCERCNSKRRRKRTYSPLMDLTGSIIGRLTVIRRVVLSVDQKTRWMCRCSCGTTTVCRADHLRSGGTRSCGCLRSAVTAFGNLAR